MSQSANDVARSASRKKILYLLRLVICAALLTYVIFRYDTTSVFLRLRQLQVHWWIVSGLIMYGAVLVSSMKWKSILRGYGRQVSVMRLWSLYIEGGFFNLFFPGFVAGDVSRAARTSGDRTLSFDAVMAVFVERFSGLVVISLFVFSVSLAGGYRQLDSWSLRLALLMVLTASLVLLALLKLRLSHHALRILPGFLGQRLQSMAEKVRYAIGTVARQPRLLFQIVALSLVFVLLSGPVAYFVARSVDVPIPLYILMLYAPLVAMLSNLPVSIAGIGVRESLSVFLYSGLGFLPEEIVAFALAQSALMLTVNLSGGLILLVRSARLHSKSKVQARWL